jgi:hypothetical protein
MDVKSFITLGLDHRYKNLRNGVNVIKRYKIVIYNPNGIFS